MGVGDVIGIVFGIIALLGGIMNLQNNLIAAIICFIIAAFALFYGDDRALHKFFRADYYKSLKGKIVAPNKNEMENIRHRFDGNPFAEGLIKTLLSDTKSDVSLAIFSYGVEFNAFTPPSFTKICMYYGREKVIRFNDHNLSDLDIQSCQQLAWWLIDMCSEKFMNCQIKGVIWGNDNTYYAEGSLEFDRLSKGFYYENVAYNVEFTAYPAPKPTYQSW